MIVPLDIMKVLYAVLLCEVIILNRQVHHVYLLRHFLNHQIMMMHLATAVLALLQVHYHQIQIGETKYNYNFHAVNKSSIKYNY